MFNGKGEIISNNKEINEIFLRKSIGYRMWYSKKFNVFLMLLILDCLWIIIIRIKSIFLNYFVINGFRNKLKRYFIIYYLVVICGYFFCNNCGLVIDF